MVRRGKIPFSPRTGAGAKAGVPETWGTFEEALAALERGGYDGIGFEFHNNGIVGIDIDHAIDPATGEVSALAREIIGKMNSYTEFSPSGTGVHIFAFGDIPAEGRKDPKKGIEFYKAKRYFTMTGNVWEAPKPVQKRGHELRELYGQLFPEEKREPPKTKPTVSRNHLAEGLERDPVLRELWEGKRAHGDETSDDMALMNKLAYWCSGDTAAMVEAFLRSPYASQKDAKHQKKLGRKDYLERTAREAAAKCRGSAAEDNARFREERDFSRPEELHPEKNNPPRPSLIRASEIPYEPPRWTIAPYFQRGKGTLVQGDNGSGKTAFMCAVTAHITTGAPLLDIPITTPGDVLILSVEDDLPVLRGRIEADGGDLTKCHFMTNAAGLTFNSPEVEAAIKEINAKMVIFDPFQAFLGPKVDMFRSNETRPELAKLFEMCERNDCSCVIIAHMGKSGGDKSPVNRSLGSVDIPAAMRSIMQLTKNPDNEDECVMVHVKCSNAPKGRSIAYTIGDRGGVHWNGYSSMTAEDITAIVKRKEKGIPYDREPLVQVFNQLIADKPGGGFWSYSDLKREGAKILGFPPFDDLNDLRSRLDSGLARELQKRDGLIITHSEKGKGNIRGIRIEQYKAPQGYQTILEG